MSNIDYYYIYCITSSIPKEENINITGLDNELVSIVRYKDICAIISSTHNTSYDSTIQNLQCHENVANQAMTLYTVLPLGFSSISKDKESVIGFLEKYYDQFKENLKKVEGKVELGIKIFYSFNEDEKPPISKNPKEYMKIMYENYKKNKLQKEELSKKIESIHNDFTKISCDSRISKPFKNNLIFNGAYLVEKIRIDYFSNQVEIIKDSYKQFKIIYSGPWSPYHFSKLIKDGEKNES